MLIRFFNYDLDISTRVMVTLWQLFGTFTKIGAFTIGGGYAMLPLIEREVVANRKWIAADEFLDMVVISQTAPGILAMNISILVGNKLRGKRGAFVSAFGAALPSFVIILLFAFFLAKYQESPVLQQMFKAVRPAVVALIAVPVFNLAKSAKLTWKTIWIPIVSAFLIWYFSVSPIWIILVAGVAGILVRLYKDYKASKNAK